MKQPIEVLLQTLQNAVLEAIALGMPLVDVAALICRSVEQLAPGAICALIGVRDGQLRPIAAPSLPAAYSQRLDGLAIGPSVGSCGTAAYVAAPVEAKDIATDPRWTDFRDEALALGLAACWSTPVMGKGGEVIATFALYFQEPRGATEAERRLVEAGVHLSAIAIARNDAEEAHHRLAFFDPLTGLPNRRSFDATIAALFADLSARFGMLLIGIDRLDSFDIGIDEISSERLLREVAARLVRLGSGAPAFNLGGGRFAVIVDPCGDRECLYEAGLAVLAALRQPRDFLSGPIERGVSIGAALAGPDGSQPEILRQNAELARLDAKSASRHGLALFRPALRAAALRRRAAMRDVDNALAEGRLMVHYQPVVDLRQRRIVGVEALTRMRGRDGQVVPAAEFAEVFGDARLAHAITDRLLDEAARDVAGWLAAGVDFGHVGINVTMSDFLDRKLGARIDAAFSGAGVPLRHVVVEVTELIVMDDPGHDVAVVLQSLRDRGVLVALDDFGTGFASLTHLTRIPSDIIKIDRAFVGGMLVDLRSAVIVESLIGIARRLGKRVVAEGIETEAQAQLLGELGCRLGQGYLYARPADAAVTLSRLSRPAAVATGIGRAVSPAAPPLPRAGG